MHGFFYFNMIGGFLLENGVLAFVPMNTKSSNGYWLPWVHCTYKSVLQGWNGSYSHTGSAKYAYDFDHVMYAPVRASKVGTIGHVKDDIDANISCCDVACVNNVNYVVIDHADGTSTLYLHLSDVDVNEGSYVPKGQQVGTAGITGYTCGTPHLHFQRQDAGIWYTQSHVVYFEEYPSAELEKNTSYRSRNYVPGDNCIQSPSVYSQGCAIDSKIISNTTVKTKTTGTISTMTMKLSMIQTKSTTGWDTYHNTKQEFSFKYPQTWQLIVNYEHNESKQEIHDESSISLLGDKSVSGFEAIGKDMVGISVYLNKWGSPKDFLKATEKAYSELSERRYPWAEVVEEIEINGKKAMVFTWRNPDRAIWSVVVQGKTRLYVFSTWPDSDVKFGLTGTERVEILSTIVDTLKIND